MKSGPLEGTVGYNLSDPGMCALVTDVRGLKAKFLNLKYKRKEGRGHCCMKCCNAGCLHPEKDTVLLFQQKCEDIIYYL